MLPKMFIYGSCLSRDTSTYFPNEWERPTYIARQSIISAASGRARLAGESKLSSAFQNRMVQNDIAGSAGVRLDRLLPEHDLLLLDLVDERRGVFEVSPNTFVTRSNEMIRSQLMKQQTVPPRVIDFGTDEHWGLWTAATDKILDIIRKHNVLTIALTPPWAKISNLGQEIQWKNTDVEKMNELFSRYNKYLEDAGIPLVSLPQELAIGDTEHRWGLSAFHYIDGAYLSMREQIFDHLARN